MTEIPKLDRKGLREFGLTTAAIIAILFGLAFPWLRRHDSPLIVWAIAGVLCLWSLIAPSSLNPLYQVWMRIGLVLGWINTRIILAIAFYAVVLPSGIFMRLVHGDPMRRQFEPGTSSYRIPSKLAKRENMEKPF